MQKQVGNKTLGGYLRKIDMLCEELKLSYQVEKDGKEYAVNIFKSDEESMDVFAAEKLHMAMFNAISFLNDLKTPPKQEEIDECSDQAEMIKNYKEPKYSF